MSPKLSEFIAQYPLKSRWLDDIVGVLLARSNGTAHIDAIVRELWGEHDINSIKQTITRSINNFCSDADDFKRSKEYDLFERVAPATYRLRSFPVAPPILELVHIEFDDGAMQLTWQAFNVIAGQYPQWSEASSERKLEAFAKNMGKDEWQSRYVGHKEYLAKASDFNLTDFGL